MAQRAATPPGPGTVIWVPDEHECWALATIVALDERGILVTRQDSDVETSVEVTAPAAR